MSWKKGSYCSALGLLVNRNEPGLTKTLELHLEGREDYPFCYPFYRFHDESHNGRRLVISVHGPGSIMFIEQSDEPVDLEFHDGALLSGFDSSCLIERVSVYGLPQQVQATLTSIHEARSPNDYISPFTGISIWCKGYETFTIVHNEFKEEESEEESEEEESEEEEVLVRLPPLHQGDIKEITIACGGLHPLSYTHLRSLGCKNFRVVEDDWL